MGLQEIVAQIKELQVYANENVESGPIETLVGRRGRKNQALNQLAQLSRQYKEEMRNGAIFIIVTGSQRDAFASMAVDNFKCFSSDPEEFYSDLTDRVPATLYLGKETLVNAFDTVGRHLEDKMMELDANSYPQLIFKQQYDRKLSSKEDFQALLKQAINEQVGAEIVGIQAVQSLFKKAIEENHVTKLTPIVLPTEDETFVAALSHDLENRLTRRTYVVVAGKATKAVKSIKGSLLVKEPTQESVMEVLNAINDSLKK